MKENPIPLAAAVPQAMDSTTVPGSATYPLRLYYIAGSSGPAVLSATTVDGVTFVAEAGVRLTTTTVPLVSASSITAATLLSLGGGGYRMLYSIVSTTGAFRIHSATSADGLAWANEAGPKFDYGANYVGAPRLVKLTSGDWRLYFVADQDGGNQAADRRVYTSRSTDEGVTWTTPSLILSTTVFEAAPSKLTDGSIRLFFSQPLEGRSSATVVGSALSSDSTGSSFSTESGLRVTTATTSGSLGFPLPVRSTDSFRWRLYYAYADTSTLATADLHSALTGAPAPVGLSPSVVYRTGGSGAFTLTGEIFSAAATVKLAKGGQADINGTGVVINSDLSISASFATQSQAIGTWDLVVTNADGQATTLPSALLIDFAPGTVDLVNNLLRPRLGIPTSINATIFKDGNVVMRIYTLDGRLVKTVLDAPKQEGAFTVTWDGRDSGGAPVASGLYILHSSGPKLSAKSKIVVIR